MRILVLGCTKLQKGFIDELIRTDWQVIVVDKNIDHLKKKLHSYYSLSVTEKFKVLKLAKRKKISGVIPMNDFAMETASYICEKLGLIGHSHEAMLALTRKSTQKLIMKKNRIRTAEFQVISYVGEAMEFF